MWLVQLTWLLCTLCCWRNTSLHRHCHLKIRDPTCMWRREPWLLEEEYGPVVKSSFEFIDVATFSHRFAAVTLRTRTWRGGNNVQVIYSHIMRLAAPLENTWLSVNTILIRAALSSDTREHKIRLVLKAIFMETPWLSTDKHRSTTAVNCVVTHNLQTEFKEGFCEIIRKIVAMPRWLKYTKLLKNYNTTSYCSTRGHNLIKFFMYTFLKFYGSCTFILCVLCCNVIKIVTVKEGPLHSYCIFLRMVFVLTCRRLVQLHAETCSMHVKLTVWIKINLCCVRLNPETANDDYSRSAI